MTVKVGIGADFRCYEADEAKGKKRKADDDEKDKEPKKKRRRTSPSPSRLRPRVLSTLRSNVVYYFQTVNSVPGV